MVIKEKYKIRSIFLALAGTVIMGNAANVTATPADQVPLGLAQYNWSGFYIGGHAGDGWARTDWTNTGNDSAYGDMLPEEGSFKQTNNGFIGGGQVGFNHQVNRFVFGVEGSFTGSTIDGTFANQLYGAADDVFKTKINNITTLTGRIGYACGNVLFYAKGGYAGAEVKFSASDTQGDTTGAGADTKWHHGWTFGGGTEYGLTPNWIIGFEYNFIDLETRSYNIGDTTGPYTFDVAPRLQEILVRISYKF